MACSSGGLAWHRKLALMLRNPRITLTFQIREHGRTRDPGLVLFQGTAEVPLTPDPAMVDAHWERAAQFDYTLPRGLFWDWLLREYRNERVAITLRAHRVAHWSQTDGSGQPTVTGEPWPTDPPPPQQPPGGGTAPRIDQRRLETLLQPLSHRLLSYCGSGGFPVVLPVTVRSIDADGIRLQAPEGMLPLGGRRAGFTAHAFEPGLLGLANRVHTGWLEVGEDGSVLYAAHTIGAVDTVEPHRDPPGQRPAAEARPAPGAPIRCVGELGSAEGRDCRCRRGLNDARAAPFARRPGTLGVCDRALRRGSRKPLPRACPSPRTRR